MKLTEQSRETIRRIDETRRTTPTPDVVAAAVRSSAGLVILKYDGERTGKRYTGHIREDDGPLGDAVQFRFPNDPGAGDLLDADDHVFAVECPAWDGGNSCWSGDDAKYWAILSPWAAMG